MTRAERWALRLGIALAFVVVLCSSCRSQMVGRHAVPDTRRDATLSFEYLASIQGTTICWEGRTYSYLLVSGTMSPLEEADTRAHEAKHREQAGRYPSCEAFNTAYKHNPAVMLESEAEAFHAGACVAIAGGKDADWLESLYTRILYARYLGGGTPIYEVVKAYRRYPCH